MHRISLSLIVATACATRAAAPAGVAAPRAAPIELARMTVTADDGFQLTLWRKALAHPRRAVLLLHGRTWSALPDFDLQVPGEARSFMDALVAEGYAAYALDLRGYGATPRDPTGWLDPARAADDVAAALRTIGDRPAVFGWSLGSMVAQLATQRHPELVGALILFGYPADPERPRPASPEPSTPPRRPTTAAAAAEDFVAPGVISARAIAAYVAAATTSDPIKVDWRDEQAWNALSPEAVRVPTLVLQAELDPYAKLDAHARLFTRLGTLDRQWVVIPGGDHAALLEDTAPRLIAAIRGFLERPPLPAPTPAPTSARPIDTDAAGAAAKRFVAVLQASRDEIGKCHAAALATDPALRRSIKLTIIASFTAAGALDKVSFAPLTSDALEACLRAVAATWRLQATTASTFKGEITLSP